MANIFISYRRDDSADVTGRIYDHLIEPLGTFEKDSIFKDVDSMPFGVNFKTYIQDALHKSKVVLAVIGPQWAEIRDSHGQRRLDNPQDFVRIEIETAFELRLPVIPLLVMNAAMPSPEQLPSSLTDLAYQNGIEIRRDPDFKTDILRLTASIEDWMNTSTTDPLPIMISYYPYNTAGKNLARQLNNLLKSHTYKTWIDYENVQDWREGNWQDNMLRVIQKCSALVAIYSAEQSTSPEFFYEIRTANQAKLRVIFLRLPGTDIPEAIAKSGMGVVDTEGSLSIDWFTDLEALLKK